MITIKIKDSDKIPTSYHPTEMLSHKWPEGQVFQQYFNGAPQNEYYINCGINEPSVVHIWHNQDTRKYNLSTDDHSSLNGYTPTVCVVPIDANVIITLEKV